MIEEALLRRHRFGPVKDYYDVIEWAASQPWCDGGVGLCGVSYLAMSQWRAAALRPPHLKAIIPWEAVSDLYREMAFQGGIPETGFVPNAGMALRIVHAANIRLHHGMLRRGMCGPAPILHTSDSEYLHGWI
jgi:putative CocE/NonD family hydrolase